MDKEMVEMFVDQEYKYGNNQIAEKFIEKIVQVPIDLYESSKQEMSSFLQEQLIGEKKSKILVSSPSDGDKSAHFDTRTTNSKGRNLCSPNLTSGNKHKDMGDRYKGCQEQITIILEETIKAGKNFIIVKVFK